MRRGEVWWACLPEPSGTRPVVLVSRDDAYCSTKTHVIVVEVSRTIRSVPTEVLLSKRDGLHARCAANAGNVLTIRKDCLQERVGMLSPRRIRKLDCALRYAMQLDPI